MVAAIPLPPQTYLRECLDYDPVTGVLTWKDRPRSHFPTEHGYLIFRGKYAGCAAGSPGRYHVIKLDQRMIGSHRVIWRWMTGEDAPLVEHRDLNRLNNAWGNLRTATQSQNCCNAGPRKRTSGIDLPKGVCVKGNGYTAQVAYEKVVFKLGYFRSAEKAHAAYVAKAMELHGEFMGPTIAEV